MAEVEVTVMTCSNPGCDQPGTSSCGACKTTPYCGPICQTADWPHHKEECPGHLLKMGKANITKATGFQREQNWVQSLRYAELAATKLKLLKDRRLETVQLIDDALSLKFDALQYMGRHREALDCIKECYTIWAMNHIRNPGSMTAAFGLIESCLHNREFEDAKRYADHAMFMINEMTDNFIPADLRPPFLARGSYLLAVATVNLARAGGIPPEEKQQLGEEAIACARQSTEIYKQLSGAECGEVARSMGALADVLSYFDTVDNDEIPRLLERSIAIQRRVDGNLNQNVAISENNLGAVYGERADRAEDANDLARCMTNLGLALTHFREAARIYRANNLAEPTDMALRQVAQAETKLQRARLAMAAQTRG